MKVVLWSTSSLMQTLAQNIEQLLYKHDCVIVPDFGGFVANYESATVNQIQGKLSPPSKAISFNKNLVNNDGLLANHISLIEGVNYEEAINIISEQVQGLKERLTVNKSVILDNIGQLVLDSRGYTRFEPSRAKNFLSDSFGLSVFNLPELRAVVEKTLPEANEKPEVTPVAELVPKHTLQNSNQNKIIPILKKVGYAAALIPFIAYLMWVPSKTEMFRGDDFTYADLNPFTEKICKDYKTRMKIGSIKSANLTNDLLQQINSSDSDIITISLFDPTDNNYDTSKKLMVRLKSFEAERESTLVSIGKKEIYKYHIIAGCFRDYKNAEMLTIKLRKQGFSSAIIDKNKGLFRVSFQSFATRWQAKRSLAAVKREHNPSAWLLIK